MELCVKILSDILELTFRKDIGSTFSDVKEIMLTALRTIIQTVISMDRENPLVGNLVSVMLAIFRYLRDPRDLNGIVKDMKHPLYFLF